MKFQDKVILDAVNVANNQVSEVIDLRFNYGYAIVATFTGSPTGNLLVEASIDKITWVQLSSDAVSATISKNVDAVYYPYLRVSKAAGGTGTMTVKIAIKGA